MTLIFVCRNANGITVTLTIEILLTNISLDETIENCVNKPFSNNDTVHNLIKKDLKELRKCASYESFFTFDNKYCCPLDSVTMGFALGPTLANVFLSLSF